ncbi:hypothetical protein RWE15_16340 [Virgibacillus halophilus]|uniref:Uncharacterized protein n=1 Tax=Tigheibacillus halophilus TaxID=361280 RepID=A0ABU5C8N4_9BACI|nr:hypothetical protein [Virgibacillus halophilus]
MQAIKLAYPDAVKWDKGATLIDAKSVDSDEGIAAFDGTSRSWSITFGIPNTDEAFLVNIHDGRINAHGEVTDEGAPPLSKGYFITDLSKVKFDSPELLKKSHQCHKTVSK